MKPRHGFAFPHLENDTGHHGMTYRQWLIGHLAGGLASIDAEDDDEWIARRAIGLADTILKELERIAKEKTDA